MVITKEDLIKTGIKAFSWVLVTIMFMLIKVKVIDKKKNKKVKMVAMSCRKDLRKFKRLDESDKNSLF